MVGIAAETKWKICFDSQLEQMKWLNTLSHLTVQKSKAVWKKDHPFNTNKDWIESMEEDYHNDYDGKMREENNLTKLRDLKLIKRPDGCSSEQIDDGRTVYANAKDFISFEVLNRSCKSYK